MTARILFCRKCVEKVTILVCVANTSVNFLILLGTRYSYAVTLEKKNWWLCMSTSVWKYIDHFCFLLSMNTVIIETESNVLVSCGYYFTL